MHTFPLGTPLSAEALELSRGLPVKPAPVELQGRYVRLAPLDLARDLEALYRVSDGRPVQIGARRTDAYDADALVWRYLFAGPFESPEGLGAFLSGLIATPNLLPLTVFDQRSGHAVGMAAYTNNFPEHLKLELGHIWYSPVVQQTHANLETAYLMLRHAFELGYRRVEWKCDALNERSRRSALRIGFRFEGIQEAHFVIKGRNRDTAWFRMLSTEWPEIQARLEHMLSRPR